MQITPQDSISDLQRMAKREKVGRVRVRILGIILAMEGRTGREIGAVFGVDQRSVREWV